MRFLFHKNGHTSKKLLYSYPKQPSQIKNSLSKYIYNVESKILILYNFTFNKKLI